MNSILDFKEKLETNLSGPKIDSILNYLLINALNPLCYTTTIPKRSMASILVQYTRDQRRKISHIPRDKAIDGIFNAIVGPKKSFVKTIRKTRLERGILSHIILYIHDKSKNYNESLSYKKQSLKALRDIRELGAKRNRQRFGASIRWSKSYFDQYIKFRNMIIEKYIRFAYNESQKAAKQTSLQIDVEDLFKNCMLGISKGIDRYDPSRGPLTACIRWWLQDVKTGAEFDHNYGHSYGVPTEKRKELSTMFKGYSQTSFSQELEDKDDDENIDHNIEIPYIKQKENEEFLKFMNKTKRTRLARLFYGVPYLLSEEEKNQLKATT